MQGNNIEETPRFCVERDHERFYATLHCIFENCEQKSRWVCASCLFWKIHQHDGRQEATHIVNIQNMQQLQQQAFKKIRHQIDGLITELMNQSQELQQSLINDSFLEFLKSQESFYNQNECFVEIQKLLGIIRQFQNVLKIKFQQFKQDIMSLNQQIMKKKQAHNKIWEQGYCYEEPNIQFEFPEVIVKNQELLKHEDQQLINYQKKWKENTQIIINNNELVRAQYNIIEMFDLENKSRMKKIQSLTKITSLCFNFDNTILFYGDYFGSIYGYSVINKYSLIFKRKLYKCSINEIYSIYDEVITISENNIIKITNFRNRKLIFLHKCQLNNMRIEQFDYDFIKGNLIIQGQDKIQIIDRLNHKLFLDYQQFSKVVDLLDIAFLQPNYIVYLSRELFRKVEINYQKRQLVCCHKFTGKQFEQFLSFSSVDYGNKFIIISEDSVYILNQNLTIFKQIPVKCDKYFHQMYNLRVKQINSMDKIIIIKNGIKFINQDKYDFWLICQEQIIESNKSENNQYFQGNLFNYLNDHQIFIQQICISFFKNQVFWLLNPQIVLYFSHKFGKYDYKSYIQSLSKLSIYFKAVTSNLYNILNAVFFGLTMNLAIVKKINRFSQQWVIYQPILDQIFKKFFLLQLIQLLLNNNRIMSQNDKKCTSSSHHTIFQASMICTIEQCDQLSRYLCIICQNEKLHEHNQLDDKHIMNQRTLSNLILSKLFHHLSYQKHLNHCYSHLLRISDFDLSFIKYQENIFCKYQHASKTKKDMIECIINYLESNMNNISPDFIFLKCFSSELFDYQKYIDRFNNEQQKINSNKSFLEDFLTIIKLWLDEEIFYQQQIEETKAFLSSNNNKIDHNQLEKLVFLKNKSYNMSKFQQDLKLLLNQQLEKLQNQTREVKLTYNDKYYKAKYYYSIDHQILQFRRAQYDNYDQYETYGQNEAQANIEVEDIQTLKITNKIKSNVKIVILKLTQDMKYLFCGDKVGQLFSFKLTNFKKIFQSKLYNKQIGQILPINNQEVLTFSEDGKLKIINYINKKSITIFQSNAGLTNNQCLIEYDRYKSLIYFCYNDFVIISRKSLKIFAKITQISHPTYLIKLVQNNSRLLVVDQNGFKLLTTSYINQSIVFKIDKQYNIEYIKFGFLNLSNQFKIIIIGKQFIKILDLYLNIEKFQNYMCCLACLQDLEIITQIQV